MQTRFEAPSRLDVWARRIAAAEMKYGRAHGRLLRLFPPVLFSEKIVWRKLFDFDPIYTRLSDKLAVRDFIAGKGFGHLLVPLLWRGRCAGALAAAALAPPFVIKSNHASGHAIFVDRNKPADWVEIGQKTAAWLTVNHGDNKTEPGYLQIPPTLLAEADLAGADGVTPEEYKVFVFHGVAKVVMHVVVDPGRDGGARERYNMFYGLPWRRLPWRSDAGFLDEVTPPPEHLAEMVAAAEQLGAGFDHMRVDFYGRGAAFFIGEISLYSWSGLGGVSPEGDAAMGDCWTLNRPVARAMHALRQGRWGVARPAL